ncbi:hypothetical protein DL240_14685 [Lujinxingia litoralis]|uniref:DUF7282 domain-containing protein n=1 Tax=Lujinxingia litoralis TaxID=2211119 RepID=A0A328C3P7_9DELT|nr:hypothetical protein [Lujinxingia litoralis]RAL20918.1 hypothetical protein DL240_14685 [Lujinxingia litoralis]
MKLRLLLCSIPLVLAPLACSSPSSEPLEADSGLEDGGSNDGGEEDGGIHDADTSDADAPDVDAEPDDHLRVERQVLTEVRDEVRIAEVLAAQPGWVAIYALEVPEDLSSAGELLGSVAIEAGVSQDVSVSLTRELEDGEWLLARLHREAPEDGVFGYDASADTPDDPPALDADGQPVAAAVEVRIPSAGLQADDQTLEFSTRVRIAMVSSARHALIAIADADEETLATAPLTPGLFEALPLTLSRPITTPGETLYVYLFKDVDENGVLDASIDTLQTDAGGAPLVLDFEVTHADPADPAPAVRFEMVASGNDAYLFESAEPAEFTDMISDPTAFNPTLTLKRGWRYEIVNLVSNAHPFDLVELGQTRAQDTLLLAQGRGQDPAPEDEAEIAWVQQDQVMRFTLAGSLTPETPPNNDVNLTGYRCAVAGHSDMRGEIVQVD